MPSGNYYSVVIPLYNKRNTILKAIDSVLLQKHDVEIIVVDDGSTDGGHKLVEEINDSRIRIIRQKNQGVSVARNVGIENATHNLVALLDADDIWAEGFLDVIDALVEQYPVAGAYATSYVVAYDDKIENVVHPLVTHPYSGTPDYFQYVRHGLYFCASSIVVRKEAMRIIGGFCEDMWVGEDIDAWGRLAFRFTIAYHSSPMAIYCLQGRNHAVCLRRAVTRSFVDSANEYLADNGKINDDILYYTNMVACNTAFRNIYSGYPQQARDVLARRPSNKLIGKIIFLKLCTYVPVRFIFLLESILRKIRFLPADI